jgi:Cys-tRNA(Pro)/Cys-tRNA(Cys) deacylase
MAKTKQNKVKTNAMRLLDVHGVPYTTFTYAGDSFHPADEVAEILGVALRLVIKTLVVLADPGRRMLIMLPSDRELDLRLAARAVDAKSVRMAAQREAEQLTGLKVGGISALALPAKHFEIYLDTSAAQLDEMYISGGQRGVTLRMRVTDLLRITRARVIQASQAPLLEMEESRNPGQAESPT